MTSCPPTAVMLRLFKGELPSEEAERVRAHLHECPTCGRTWVEVEETWQALGFWEIETGDVDWTDRVVVDAALNRPRSRSGRVSRVWRLAGVRAAAAVMAAAGLGIGAGGLLPYARSAPAEATPEWEDVAGELGLPDLASEPSSGLPSVLGADADWELEEES